MGLIDYCLRPRPANALVAIPIEIGILHHTLDHEGGTVTLIERQILVRVTDAVTIERIVPDQFTGNLLGVGIEQKFVRIETMTQTRIIRPAGTIAVNCARLEAGNIAGLDIALAPGKRHPRDFLLAISGKEAEVHLFCMGGSSGCRWSSWEKARSMFHRRVQQCKKGCGRPVAGRRRMRTSVISVCAKRSI